MCVSHFEWCIEFCGNWNDLIFIVPKKTLGSTKNSLVKSRRVRLFASRFVHSIPLTQPVVPISVPVSSPSGVIPPLSGRSFSVVPGARPRVVVPGRSLSVSLVVRSRVDVSSSSGRVCPGVPSSPGRVCPGVLFRVVFLVRLVLSGLPLTPAPILGAGLLLVRVRAMKFPSVMLLRFSVAMLNWRSESTSAGGDTPVISSRWS